MSPVRSRAIPFKIDRDPARFYPIQDPLRIRRLLNDAAEGRVPITLWTQGRLQVIKAQVRSLEFPNGKSSPFEIVVKCLKSDRTKNFFGLVHHTPKQVAFGMLYFAEEQRVVGFQVAVKRFMKNFLILGTPQLLYRVQRRKDRRYQIPSGYDVKVQIPSLYPKTHKGLRMMDISIGGLSFWVNPKERDRFEKNQKLDRVIFQIRNHPILTKLTLQSIRKDQGGYRVGCQFMGLKESDQTLIFLFIAEKKIQFS